MKLPGWQSLGGSRGRYVNPQGEEVSRREYLNAQAQSVGFNSYSQYQRELSKPTYAKFITHADDPKAARRLDSAFNSMWAKSIMPKLNTGGKIARDMWMDAFDAADVPEYDDERDKYH